MIPLFGAAPGTAGLAARVSAPIARSPYHPAMPSRYARWRALPPADRRTLLSLGAMLPLVASSLRVLGFDRTRRLLERGARREARAADAADLAAGMRLAALAEVAGRASPLKAACLPQAFLVCWLLRRRGLDPKLEIGVQRRGEAIDAHAWVELDGVALATVQPAHTPLRDGESLARG